MAFSYDPALSTPKDQIRLLIQDTDGTDPLTTDEGITFLLTVWGSVYRTAGAVCELVAAQFARDVNVHLQDDVSIDAAARYQQYLAMAKQYKAQANLVGAGFYAGGISVADKNLQDQNLDRMPPLFTREQFTERATEPLSSDPFTDVPTAPVY